jgi:hypothetical protein
MQQAIIFLCTQVMPEGKCLLVPCSRSLALLLPYATAYCKRTMNKA